MQDWLFRTLVRLLPEEFRAGYARDMAATFRAERRQARSWGRILWLWSATIPDLARTAPADHLDILARHVRFAFRTMAARPGATAAAGLTLGLGWGANVAMFAAIDAGCAAVRVNPGNIKQFDDKVAEIAKAASDAGVSLRIGVNAGSLDRRLLAKYGAPTPEALVALSLIPISEPTKPY